MYNIRKKNDPILRKFSNRQTERQTVEIVICPINVERPKMSNHECFGNHMTVFSKITVVLNLYFWYNVIANTSFCSGFTQSFCFLDFSINVNIFILLLKNAVSSSARKTSTSSLKLILKFYCSLYFMNLVIWIFWMIDFFM